jgi:glycosyltransferase involved in cell wall biosynthesis
MRIWALYPSIYEGFGLPPLEALVAGASVLCSDIEVFHETCNDLVSFFPLDDPSALSQLLTAPAQKASMSTAESVCHRFNWEDSAEQILWCATHCA